MADGDGLSPGLGALGFIYISLREKLGVSHLPVSAL